MDVSLIDEDERRSWGNPGCRGQACNPVAWKTCFFDLTNGTTVGSRNWCNNSVTHPRHSRKKKKGKRLTTAKDLSMGGSSTLTVTFFIAERNTLRRFPFSFTFSVNSSIFIKYAS